MNRCVNNNVLSNAIDGWKRTWKNSGSRDGHFSFRFVTHWIINNLFWIRLLKSSNHVPCISINPLASVMAKKSMENFFTNLRLVQTTSCRGFNLKKVKHIRLTFLLLSLCFHAIQFWRVATPSPHFEACLARWHLSYSRALMASSLVLNEVIKSSTYTCNRIMAIASGWSFLLSSACCRTTYWAR